MSTRVRRRSLGSALGAAAFVGAALTAATFVGACTDATVYAFDGQKYDAVDHCLLPQSVIDVISGTAEGSCTGVRCFEGSDGTAYVSAQCKAPPGYTDHTTDTAATTCEAALHAYSLGTAGACPST